MEKIIKIDGKEARFVANGATPRLYRALFMRDVFADMTNAIDKDGNIQSAEVFENLAFTMARQGGLDRSVDITDWLMGMESPTAIIEAAPDIIELWTGTNTTLVQSKKK